MRSQIIVLITISLIGYSSVTSAQELNIELNYEGFFDNREYFHDLSPHYSLFGHRIAPGVYFKLKDNISFHSGFSYVQEFGDLIGKHKADFYGYLARTGKYTDFYFGIYPRTNFGSLHRVLLNDTINYFRPYIEGMGIRLNTKHGKLEGWMDWTSRQTDTIRESFLISINGEWLFHNFFVNHQLLALHYANPGISTPDDHIRDNIGTVFLAGYKPETFLFFDQISLGAGAIVSFDRLRTVYDWRTPAGFLIDLHLKYKLVSLDALYYSGDGHNLVYGDNFYKASSYVRFDGNLHLFSGTRFNGLVQFSMHLIEGEVNYSQLLKITLNLDQPIYTFETNR